MPKIVSITGAELPQPDTVDPDIVTLLERWLQRARDGELKGIAISGQHQNGDAGSAWSGTLSIQMLGSLQLLTHNLTRVLSQEDTDEP